MILSFKLFKKAIFFLIIWSMDYIRQREKASKIAFFISKIQTTLAFYDEMGNKIDLLENLKSNYTKPTN